MVYAYVRLYGLNLECFYQRLIGKLSSAKEQRAPHRVHMDIKFGVAREGGVDHHLAPLLATCRRASSPGYNCLS